MLNNLVELTKHKSLKNVSNGYEDISVELIDYNKDIAKHAWECYRMTWHTLADKEYDVNDKDVQEAIDNIIHIRALPMPREQAIMTFRINNISRVCLAQITRQRKAAFNVESQMPLPVRHNVILPLNFCNNTNFTDRATKLIEESQQLYNDMIAAGYPPQDCRYLLLHGQTTSLVYVVDVNTFISSFGFRCENNLSDEINLVYRLCKHAILMQIEQDRRDGIIDELSYKFYYDIIAPSDAAGAAQHVGKNYDKVFGNSFKRYPDANIEVTDITANCDYDYTKSAWYLELQRMPDYLLFKDEKEMIASWKNDDAK